MPSADDYTSLSIRKGLKEDLRRAKFDGETYSDFLQRSIAQESEIRDRIENMEARQKQMQETQQQMARLQVRMAYEIGVPRERVPADLLQLESWQDGHPFSPKLPIYDLDDDQLEMHDEAIRKKRENKREKLMEETDRGYVMTTDDDGELVSVPKDEYEDSADESGGDNE